MSKKGGFGKFLVGAGIGAGLGLLFAPKKGSETRRELKIKLDELWCSAKEVDLEEVKEQFQTKIDEIKRELDDLDKEKVLSIAKEKGEQLKTKAEELIALAKEKGTPVLENVAQEIKDKSVIVLKEAIKRIENSEKKSK